MGFEEADEKVNFYIEPHPQPVTPLRGPMGSPWELSWTSFILRLRRYLHTKELDCSTAGSGENNAWNLHSFGPLGPSPWAPMGAKYTIWTTLNPRPLRMISCQVLVKNKPCVFKKKMKQLLFTLIPPAPQGPNGATLGTVMNNFYSSPTKVSAH